MTTVLVAEDDDGVRLLLVTALRRHGFEVLSVADGQAAVDLLDRDDLVIDAVVSDVNMPGAGGLDVLERARARRPGIALVLASGTDRWKLPAEQLASDVTLLEKPYGLDRLMQALDVALARGRDAAMPVSTPRFVGLVQAGYGIGAQLMGDPELAARQRHHFTRFDAVPGTLNVRLPEPFDARLFTKVVTSWELGGVAEDHPYSSVVIEGTIPGFVTQTRHPAGDFPPEVVELIADRHLRSALGLADGDQIAFELDATDHD